MNSDSRDRVLQKIREAASALPPAAPPAEAGPAERGRLFPRGMQKDELVALFLERAESSGARVHVARSLESLKSALGAIIPPEAAMAVACCPSFLERLGAGPADLVPEGRRTIKTAGEHDAKEAGKTAREGEADLFTINTAVTDADCAVAETGSIVLLARKDRARLASLVAKKHIALVRPDQIVPDLIDWAKHPAGEASASLAGAMTVITGPSKTADIEIKLVIGVHGPAELHLVVLDF